MEDFSAGEFLQGFLEEAGEHLQRIHEHLLRLEQVAGGGAQSANADEATLAARSDLLAELFRSFHTLKGLAGMVSLNEAATLSHAMESVLRATQQGDLLVDQELIDRLFEGAGTLDLVINTVRDRGASMPDIQPVLQRLQSFTSAPVAIPAQVAAVTDREPAEVEANGAQAGGISAPIEVLLPGMSVYPDLIRSLGELEQQKVRAGLAAGHFFSIVVFASSAERAARGENVDQVRHQLQQVGTVIKAVPVLTEGVFRFMFLVSSVQPLEEGMPLADEVIPLVSDLPIPGPQQAPQAASTLTGRTSEGAYASARGLARAVSAVPVVRVNLDRLDELMRLTGDLVRLRSKLGEDLTRLQGIPDGQRRQLASTYQQIGRSLRDLRRAVLRARMVPLSEAFNRMPLVVRDLARASQKEVRLTVQGENNEVDKLLVEQLLDPLIHLVRNAIIHGIESPEDRAAAGKSPAGNLMLRGIPEGDHVLIEVEDDGRGIDLRKVAARAAAMGLYTTQSGDSRDALDAEEALELISMPGFSTHGQADLSAGRGIGLDIVTRMVRAFGGSMQMQTRPGEGTLFRLRLPLTLVIVDVLLVRTGQNRYAVPRDSVERIIEIEPGSITYAESGEMLPVKINGSDSYYVLHRLRSLLGEEALPAGGANSPGKLFGLVLPSENGFQTATGNGRPVLVVDQVVDMREVVVQTFTDPLVARPGVAGATELGDGGLAIILDSAGLMRAAQKFSSAQKRG